MPASVPESTDFPQARILVVDDEALAARAAVRSLLPDQYDCVIAADGASALEQLERTGADLVVTDLIMPAMDGLELMHRVRERHPALPVIVLTADAGARRAVQAMRDGAFDYVTKPFDDEQLRTTVSRALAFTRLERDYRFLRQSADSTEEPPSIVAASPRTRELFSMVRRLGAAHTAVVIEGEHATGKALAARILHYWSDRANGPFFTINCAAYDSETLESEMFGRDWVAEQFTRSSIFKRAAGGTLLLKAIDCLEPELQVRLMAVIRDRLLPDPDAAGPVPMDVRIVATSSRKLGWETSAGRFSQELLGALGAIPLYTQPLREHPEDAVALARQMVAAHGAESGRRLVIGEAAEAALAAHPWPGNINELESVMERAMILAPGATIDRESLVLDQWEGGKTVSPEGTLQAYLDRAAVVRIQAALVQAKGSRVIATQILGVDRSTLYRMMKRLGMPP